MIGLNSPENVRDFEDDSKFINRKILMKKGVNLEEDSLRHLIKSEIVKKSKGIYILELSQTKNIYYIVAYSVENIGVKYVKKLPINKGIKLMQECSYDIDRIAERVKIAVREKRLYL